METLNKLFYIFHKKPKKCGRIKIPSLRINIPLYKADGNAQEIVDAWNSAAYIQWADQIAIVDHKGQNGFERLKYATPNQTLAYIENDIREMYLCTKNQTGHIIIGTPNRLVDENYGPVKSDGLVMYSCMYDDADKIMDVYLTYWKKI